MKQKDFKAAVKKFHGWIDGDKARFPTVHLMQEFIKYCETYNIQNAS